MRSTEQASPGRRAQSLRREAGVVLTDGASCGASGKGFVGFVFRDAEPNLRQALV